MNTTKKIVWRLSKLPTIPELDLLIRNDVLTKEEAREILFSSEEQSERDKKSLESEIKFLRELVQQLSKKDNSRIIEVIKEVEVTIPTIRRNPWYSPYEFWYTNGTTGIDANKMYCANTTSTEGSGIVTLMATSDTSNFSDIKSF